MEGRYLLNVKPLIGDEKLSRDALMVLDPVRLKKTQKVKKDSIKAQSIGAGLLLKYIWNLQKQEEYAAKNHSTIEVQKLSLPEVIDYLRDKENPSYMVKQNGKPYFAYENDDRKKLMFSLSHSEKYVFIACSDSEIGADIQFCEAGVDSRKLVKRFFSEKENLILEQMSDKDREKEFYRLWSKKEAYGKMMGTGMLPTLSMTMEDLSDVVDWEFYEQTENYVISVCKSK